MVDIKSRFGTLRGLVRTCLDQLLWLLGPYRRFGKIRWQSAKRLVFVCQGNICRSPFAFGLASNLAPALPLASIGLSTTTGKPADPVAVDAAQEMGVSLADHRATDVSNFTIEDGDVLLVMEARHINTLKPLTEGKAVQVALLGLWARPRFALLYDPFSLSRQYFETCFYRIDQAVRALLVQAANNRNQFSG